MSGYAKYVGSPALELRAETGIKSTASDLIDKPIRRDGKMGFNTLEPAIWQGMSSLQLGSLLHRECDIRLHMNYAALSGNAIGRDAVKSKQEAT